MDPVDVARAKNELLKLARKRPDDRAEMCRNELVFMNPIASSLFIPSMSREQPAVESPAPIRMGNLLDSNMEIVARVVSPSALGDDDDRRLGASAKCPGLFGRCARVVLARRCAGCRAQRPEFVRTGDGTSCVTARYRTLVRFSGAHFRGWREARQARFLGLSGTGGGCVWYWPWVREAMSVMHLVRDVVILPMKRWMTASLEELLHDCPSGVQEMTASTVLTVHSPYLLQGAQTYSRLRQCSS